MVANTVGPFGSESNFMACLDQSDGPTHAAVPIVTLVNVANVPLLYCVSHFCYQSSSHHDTHTHPDLPDLPLSNAKNVASYTLFLTYMDSRSSRAMVVI